jgi:hypothetical protein
LTRDAGDRRGVTEMDVVLRGDGANAYLVVPAVEVLSVQPEANATIAFTRFRAWGFANCVPVAESETPVVSGARVPDR